MTRDELAQKMMSVAFDLGECMVELDEIGKTDFAAIKSEQTAYETIIIDGADVVYALKSMAMRFDRGALGRYLEGRDEQIS